MSFKLMVLWIFAAIVGTHATSKLIVIHSPPSIIFQAVLGVTQESLKEMYCVALGFSSGEVTDGEITLVNPFDTPEAIVEVQIDTSTDIFATHENSKIFLLPGDHSTSDTYDYISNKIKNLKMNGNKLVNMLLSDEFDVSNHQSMFGDLTSDLSHIPRKTLTYSVDQDADFLRELLVLNAVVRAIRRDAITPDHKVDFFHFTFNSLRNLVDHYGLNSEKTQEAKDLLSQEIKELSTEFIRAYQGNILFTVVLLDEDKRRLFKRQFKGVSGGSDLLKDIVLPQEKDTPDDRAKDQQAKDQQEKDQQEKDHQEKDQQVKNQQLKDQQVQDPQVKDQQAKDSDTVQDTAQDNNPPSLPDPNSRGANDPSTDSMEDFPIMLNIIFWICFSWYMSVLAIVRVFMTMDPGRDTVVYRMTNVLSRLKIE